jgi:IS4 transposase
MNEIIKYLPKGWEKQAKETGALTRSRNIKTAEELLALNMLYITNEGSFQMASMGMKLMKGISVNKNAAYKRIKASGEWLRVMAQGLCEEQGVTIKKPDFLGDHQVKLIDASDETTKGEAKSTWRLHYVFNLFEFQCPNMELTTNKEGERLTRHEIFEKDIVIADRIYCTMSGIEHVLNRKGNFVLRFKSKAFNLYDESGNPLELLPYLRHLEPMENTSVDCYYKLQSGELRPLRIVAMKKDAKAIAESKRKMKRKASKKQEKAVQADTAELNEYVVLATSLDYTNEQILELYRARWQIEQVFFRLKSLFGYGDVPSKNPDTVKAWFYGKLFLAALCERVLKALSFSPETEFFIDDIVGAKLMV